MNVRRVGFTLVEMLVAVAAVGLIALGLAQLFQRTGDTVRVGRRLSVLNETATMFERTMREDVRRMSRDGFLVIKHRLAPDQGDPQQGLQISLTKDDLSPRERRIDELVFFREGVFGSQREPLHPSRYPVGTSARIYYGHGLRQSIGSANSNAYTPLEDDLNDGTNPARASQFGEPGPNLYASTWTLLRHETALCQPRLTLGADRPPNVRSGPLDGRWADSRIQVGLQPAAADVFRIVASDFPTNTTGFPGVQQLVRQTGRVRLPNFTSGIVDIAATDLPSVRARILNAQPLNATQLSLMQEPGTRRAAPFSLQAIDPPTQTTDPYENWTALAPGQQASYPTQNPLNIAQAFDADIPAPTTARMKRWMIEAFPADALPGPSNEPNRERRMRYEPSPPDLTGMVSGTAYPPDEPWRRTDQRMLSASNFVVGCTEFIVEWSFGDRYPTNNTNPNYPVDYPDLAGQLVWHGLPRLGDLNGNGTLEYLAHPYNSDEPGLRPSGTGAAFVVNQAQVFARYNADTSAGVGVLARRFPRAYPNRPATPLHVHESGLIHEPAPLADEWRYPNAGSNEQRIGSRLFSCFGYVDPTFGYHNPASASDTPRPGEPSSAPCPWPRLLRITISLVEASEPLREQTYQFILRVPDAGEQQAEF